MIRHWLIRWACGCVKEECACGRSASNHRKPRKAETWLYVHCPEHRG